MVTEHSPRTNPHLFGHEDAEEYWLKARESGKLAHGWILSGPKGIGKSTLAYRFARTLLGDSPRIASGAHPDMLVVEPLFEEKKGERKDTILAEQAREIPEFMSMTPAEGDWRVVIVDSVDQLNEKAANAILKVLEEPPAQAILLLISHNPGSLLPTIRSRCAMLKLKPLGDADFSRTMETLAPELDNATLSALHMFSSGAPGMAVDYAGQGASELYTQFLSVLPTLPALDSLKIHTFADQFGGVQTHAQFRLFTELALTLLSRVCKAASGVPVAAVSEEEQAAIAALVALHSPAVWAAKWQQAEREFSLAITRHLDYKQVAIVFFHSLAQSEPFSLGAAA